MKRGTLHASMALASLMPACVPDAASPEPAVVSLALPEPAQTQSALVVAGPAAPITSPGSAATSVTELACAREDELRSLVSKESLELDFQNATDALVTLEWLDFDGARVRYAVLEPGDSYLQQTYVTHPWLAVGEDGKCLRAFVPQTTGRYTVRILGPGQRATTRWK